MVSSIPAFHVAAGPRMISSAHLSTAPGAMLSRVLLSATSAVTKSRSFSNALSKSGAFFIWLTSWLMRPWLTPSPLRPVVICGWYLSQNWLGIVLNFELSPIIELSIWFQKVFQSIVEPE